MRKIIFIIVALLFLISSVLANSPDTGSADEIKNIQTPDEIAIKKGGTVCGDKVCEVDERYENCPQDCRSDASNIEEKRFGKEEKKSIFQRIINFFRKLFGKEDKLCKEFCDKSVAHADCAGHWEISGTYPDCKCNFVCEKNKEQISEGEKQVLPESEVKCPDGVCDDFEMREGVCAEDCKSIEGWVEKTGQPEEVESEELVRKPKEEEKIEGPKKEEGTQKPSEKITSTYNWLMLGHDPEHSSFSDSTAPNDNNIFFSYNADLPEPEEKDVEKDVNGLVFEHNRVYYSFDKFVYALDIPTGNMVWYSNLGEPSKGIAIANNIIFVSAGKKLYALNIDTGNKLWSYETSGEITPPVVSDKIYFGSKDYNFYAIKTDGKLAWKFKVDSEIHSVPAVSDGKVCFGTENTDFSVYCLDTNTGKSLWRRTFSTTGGEGGMFHAPPTVHNNMVLIGEEGGKRGRRTSGTTIIPAPSNLYALNIDTGETVWSYKATDWIVTVPAVGYDKVYFSTWDNNIYAVNIADGKLVWKSKGGSMPAVADGKVFVGSSDTIYSYDANTGKELWKYQSEDNPSFLIIGEGNLYAGFTAEDVVKKYQIVGFGKK